MHTVFENNDNCALAITIGLGLKVCVQKCGSDDSQER